MDRLRLASGTPGVLEPEPVATLADVHLFAAATPQELATLAAAAGRRLLAPGEVLLLEGERSDSLYVVARGRLKVMLSSARGGELVLALLGPGEALGELSVLDGQSRSASAQATVATELLVLPGAVVRAVLSRSPQLAMAWALELAAQVRRLTGSKADLVFLDLPRRLAKLLLDGPGTRAEPSPRVDLGQSQTEVAARLGVARQSLNRALSALQARGWVRVDGSTVVLLDRAALESYAGS